MISVLQLESASQVSIMGERSFEVITIEPTTSVPHSAVGVRNLALSTIVCPIYYNIVHQLSDPYGKPFITSTAAIMALLAPAVLADQNGYRFARKLRGFGRAPAQGGIRSADFDPSVQNWVFLKKLPKLIVYLGPYNAALQHRH